MDTDTDLLCVQHYPHPYVAKHNPHSYADADTNANSHSYADADANLHSHTDAISNCYF